MSRIVQQCVLSIFAITLALSPLRGVMAFSFTSGGGNAACADMHSVMVVSESVPDTGVNGLQTAANHYNGSCCDSGVDHFCGSCVHAIPGLLSFTLASPDQNPAAFRAALDGGYSTRSFSPPLRPPASFPG